MVVEVPGCQQQSFNVSLHRKSGYWYLGIQGAKSWPTQKDPEIYFHPETEISPDGIDCFIRLVTLEKEQLDMQNIKIDVEEGMLSVFIKCLDV